MKNIFKIGLCALIVGEFLALFYKDKNFRQRFEQAEGINKLKIALAEIIDLNKQLFQDVKNKDYQIMLKQIEENIELLKKDLDKVNIEKFKPALDMVIEKLNTIKQNISSNTKDGS